MIQVSDPKWMIVGRPTTQSKALHESLVLMQEVMSLSTSNIVVVGSTQPVDIEMPIIIDILVVPSTLTIIAPI